jgi:drug/metabolite transporter (DMT)-like permease
LTFWIFAAAIIAGGIVIFRCRDLSGPGPAALALLLCAAVIFAAVRHHNHALRRIHFTNAAASSATPFKSPMQSEGTSAPAPSATNQRALP